MEDVKTVLLKCFTLLLAAFFVIDSAQLTQAQKAPSPSAQPVVVTNTAAQPVPTVVQGTTTVTGSVSVANTPSVTVTNTPAVNVSNTPNVNVANTPTVTVANSASNPIPVTVTNPAVRTPWWQSLVSTYPGPPIGPSSYTVPLGSRVVIEYANVHVILGNPMGTPGDGLGLFVPEALLMVTPGSTGSPFNLELGPTGHVFSETNRYFAASLPIKVILMPGWTIDIADNAAGGTDSGGGTVWVYLSGYTEPAP